MTVLSTGLSMVLMAAALTVPQAPAAAPAASGTQVFDVVATLTPTGAAKGSITATVVIELLRFTSEPQRTVMTDALKYSGYPGFLNALRAAPQVGTLDVAGQTFIIRWAREVPSDTGRTISIVTDHPVFFAGSNRPGAKSTAGYEVAVIQLVLDKAGHGTGTMAAAARVKPGGETGVRIDSYAENSVALAVTQRAAK